MAEYRRQHHVPVTYLQFFDQSGSPRGRQSRLYAGDGEKSFKVGVENVAVESYLYSSGDPAAAEAFFYTTERKYEQLVNSILAGEESPLFVSLVAMQIAMMHFRNAKYDVEGFDERIGAVDHSTTRFLYEVLLDQRNPRTQEEYIDIIDQLWALQIVHSTSDRFNTSDNPSLMFTTGDGNAKDIVALMLPITPDRLVVLRRRAATEAISDVASKEDASRFNGLQAVAADRFVFSTEPLEPADLEAMKRLDARFPFANGVLAQDWWRPNALNKFEPGFSFVEM